MKIFIDYINILLPLLYILTFTVYLFDFLKEDKKTAQWKSIIFILTLLIHCSYLVVRTIQFKHFPITNVFEIFTVLSFAVAFSYLLLEFVTGIKGTGPFILIFSLLFQILSTIFIKDMIDVRPVLRSNLLGSHVFSALLGYAGITISAVYGILYLMLYKDIKLNKFGIVFNRLPSLDILETLSFNSAIIGFVLLSIAITIGVIWLPMVFPNYKYYDPKLIGTLLVWLLYALGITGKIIGKWRGKKIITLSIMGFVIAISSTIITNFLSASFHSFY